MPDWITAVERSFTSSTTLLVSFLPKVFVALLLVVAGLIIGRLLSVGLTRILELTGINRLLSRTAIQTVLERAGTQKSFAEILGVVGFWIVFLLFLISATETLGLAIVSQALTGLAYFLPKVGLAVVIVVLGLFAANFLREVISLACTSAGVSQGAVVAQTFYVGMALLVVVTAINELGIDTTLLNNTIILLITGIIAGSALSFGLGARTAIANLIAAHYLQPVLKVGQTVRVGNITGEVVSLTPVAVVVQTKEGRAIIPASQFSESTTVVHSND